VVVEKPCIPRSRSTSPARGGPATRNPQSVTAAPRALYQPSLTPGGSGRTVRSMTRMAPPVGGPAVRCIPGGGEVQRPAHGLAPVAPSRDWRHQACGGGPLAYSLRLPAYDRRLMAEDSRPKANGLGPVPQGLMPAGSCLLVPAPGPTAHGSWPMARGHWPLPRGSWPAALRAWPMTHGVWIEGVLLRSRRFVVQGRIPGRRPGLMEQGRRRVSTASGT